VAPPPSGSTPPWSKSALPAAGPPASARTPSARAEAHPSDGPASEAAKGSNSTATKGSKGSPVTVHGLQSDAREDPREDADSGEPPRRGEQRGAGDREQRAAGDRGAPRCEEEAAGEGWRVVLPKGGRTPPPWRALPVPQPSGPPRSPRDLLRPPPPLPVPVYHDMVNVGPVVAELQQSSSEEQSEADHDTHDEMHQDWDEIPAQPERGPHSNTSGKRGAPPPRGGEAGGEAHFSAALGQGREHPAGSGKPALRDSPPPRLHQHHALPPKAHRPPRAPNGVSLEHHWQSAPSGVPKSSLHELHEPLEPHELHEPPSPSMPPTTEAPAGRDREMLLPREKSSSYATADILGGVGLPDTLEGVGIHPEDPSVSATIWNLCPHCMQAVPKGVQVCEVCDGMVQVDDQTFLGMTAKSEWGSHELADQDVPTWALPANAPVNRHKVLMSLEGYDPEEVHHMLPPDWRSHRRAITESGGPLPFSPRRPAEGWKPRGVATNGHHGASHTDFENPGSNFLHMKVTREKFKRSRRDFMDHTFWWEDDDVDDTGKEKAEKAASRAFTVPAAVGKAWQDLTGGFNWKPPDVIFDKLFHDTPDQDTADTPDAKKLKNGILHLHTTAPSNAVIL